MRTIPVRTINAYHLAALAYLALAAGCGAIIAAHASPDLQVSGWFILHAHLAFMGFGTLTVLGTQKVLAAHVRAGWDGFAPGAMPGARFLAAITLCLAGIWAMYLAQGLTGNNAFYIGGMAAAAGALACLAAYTARLYRGITLATLRRNMPARFFLTSMFICFLAYGQLIYITAFNFLPWLPFSHTMPLRVNYLALSFPLSLTVMACIRMPFHLKDESLNKARFKPLWESQYAILVAGVFSLFFSLIFDSPHFHDVYSALQAAFSGILFLSILLLIGAMITDRRADRSLPWGIWRLYVSAVAYLFLAGIAGFLLGYGWNRQGPEYYFLIQAHIHLALLGWIGFGLTGVYSYLLHMAGRAACRHGSLNFWLMHAGVILMLLGIWHKSWALRGAAGACVAAAALTLMACAASEYRLKSGHSS